MPLRASDLALRRGDKLLFEGLSFSAGPRQRLGVVGPNGCGKSSLFAALTGRLEPDAGSIARPPDWTFGAAAQESPSGSQSAIDFVLGALPAIDKARRELGDAERVGDGEAQAQAHRTLDELGGYDASARAASVLSGLGFSDDEHDKPLDAFSGGWRSRLALARTLLESPDVLLLDEPTNHLDLETIDWLAQWCGTFSGLILVVSHDRDFLDRVATHIVWIDRPKPRYYQGNLSKAEEQRTQILTQEAARFARNAKRAQELQGFVDRFRAKASKATQAQSRLKMLERLEMTAPLAEYAGYQFSFPRPERLPSPLLVLDHADIGYGEEPILRDVHLSVLPGERIGILGRNGSGKSTLIRALAGQLAPSSRRAAPKLAVGYFAQHQLDQLVPRDTPLEHLQRLAPEAGEQPLRDYLGGFGFHGDHAVEPIAPRSGGEKSRLALALLAWQAPQLLLLDEPTNHLDLQMRDALAIALQDYPGAVIVVSHDRAFLSGLCDIWWHVRAGRVHFADSVESTLRVDRAQASQAAEPPPQERKRRRQEAVAARARLRPLTDRVSKLEKAMERTRSKLEGVREELADPQLYTTSDSAQIAELSARSDRLELEIESLEADWFEAQEALEAAQEPT